MALPINIDDLINARTVESVRIEFKKGWNPEEVIHTMCAYANDIKEYGSGYIIVGIEESNGNPILPPAGLNPNQLDKIQKEFINLCHQIQPNIYPVIEPIEFMGEYIIIIWVTTGEERPYSAPSTLGGKAIRKIYVRPSSASIPASTLIENRLRELAAYRHFDDRINMQANIDDLDLGLIQAYLQEVKSNLYSESTKLTLSEIATKMQIVRGPKENLRPLNVGLLLFNKRPDKFFSGCITNLIEFEDEAGIKYSEKNFTGPIHTQIKDITSYLKTNIIKQYIKKSEIKLEVDKFFNFPYQALEEAIVNSLYHRSYENPTPNEIRIYRSFKKSPTRTDDPRRIEILSYPGPLPPIDEQALIDLKITARNYRNIKLGDWLKNLRLAEKYATGIPTIVASLSENGSPSPILTTDESRSYFLVTIKMHESTPNEEETYVSELVRVSLTNQQQNILEILQYEPSSEDDLIKKLDQDIASDLKYLNEKEIVSFKIFGDIKIVFITKRGSDALNNSF